MTIQKEMEPASVNKSRENKPVRTAKPVSPGKKKGHRPETIIDVYRQDGGLGTEFRRVCDRIGWTTDTSGKPTGPKHVLVTSAVTAEGKSTVASIIALTAAIYLDQRTLLIDGDMRKPSLHRLFGHALPGGLADCLSGQSTFDACLRTTDVEKLKLMTAGTSVFDPTELLSDNRWSDLLAEAAFYFDRIVIDCAPVIPVDDAIALGRVVDGVLMVVRAGKTQREVAARAADIIREGRLNLLGIVVNNLDQALPYYYNQSYYGYRYTRRSR